MQDQSAGRSLSARLSPEGPLWAPCTQYMPTLLLEDCNEIHMRRGETCNGARIMQLVPAWSPRAGQPLEQLAYATVCWWNCWKQQIVCMIAQDCSSLCYQPATICQDTASWCPACTKHLVMRPCLRLYRCCQAITRRSETIR